MPSGLGRAARELEANGSTIVKTREQAGELFYRLFGNQGYRNATGFDGVGTKQYFGSKAMTYHWDELLDAAGNLAGHGPNNSDGLYRHLQIHLPDERVLHIFFGPKIGG
jgi:hypothetical protein